MKNLIPVKDNPGLMKDTKSGGIVNINKNEIEEARKRKRQKLKEKERFDQMESDLKEIKMLLRKLL